MSITEIYIKLISKLRGREELLMPLKKNINDYVSFLMPRLDDERGIDQSSVLEPLKTSEIIISELLAENSSILKSLEEYIEDTPAGADEYDSEMQEGLFKRMNEDIESIARTSQGLAENIGEFFESIKHNYEEDSIKVS